VFLIVYSYFVFFTQDYLLSPDNAIPANPLSTPPHIVPEWYLLPYYAILRAIPNKLAGVIAMFGSIGVLFLVSWLDTSRVRSALPVGLSRVLLAIDGGMAGACLLRVETARGRLCHRRACRRCTTSPTSCSFCR